MLTNTATDDVRPYLKAIIPAVLALVAALSTALSTGTFHTTEMQVALVGLIAACVAFVVRNGERGWRRYMKALTPAVLTVVGVLVHYALSGEWNHAEWAIALSGLGSAAVTFLVPNLPPTVGGDVHPAAPGLPVSVSYPGKQDLVEVPPDLGSPEDVSDEGDLFRIPTPEEHSQLGDDR